MLLGQIIGWLSFILGATALIFETKAVFSPNDNARW